MLGLFLLAAQAAAPTPVQCTIAMEKGDQESFLIGRCNKSAVMLGLATEFESASHPPTGSAVALVKRESATHVLLIRPTANENAFLEDITADLAKQVGQSPDIGITGLSIDISRFNEDGTVRVSSSVQDSKTGSNQSGAVSAAMLIANEEARLALPPEGARVINVVVEARGSEGK